MSRYIKFCSYIKVIFYNDLGFPTRINPETNNPEWKDVGADTWNPFKGGFSSDDIKEEDGKIYVRNYQDEWILLELPAIYSNTNVSFALCSFAESSYNDYPHLIPNPSVKNTVYDGLLSCDGGLFTVKKAGRYYLQMDVVNIKSGAERGGAGYIKIDGVIKTTQRTGNGLNSSIRLTQDVTLSVGQTFCFGIVDGGGYPKSSYSVIGYSTVILV